MTSGEATSASTLDHAGPPAHARFVRLTHWVNTAAFVALVVSGVAILLAHPRLYWGETGGFGSRSLIDLPLPLDLDQSGWGRSLHFLAAWVCVINGGLYVAAGLWSRHFTAHMLPWRAGARQGSDAAADDYHPLQRAVYLAIVFAAFPLAVLTGLAMSPAVMAAVPVVDLFGGHQSARTIHFFTAAVLVLFLTAHIVMIGRSGFVGRMRRMITG